LAVCKPCCYSEVTNLIQLIGINNKIYIQITAIFTHPADWYVYAIYIRNFIIAKIMKEASGAGIGSVL
jgi:hypothetical protein